MLKSKKTKQGKRKKYRKTDKAAKNDTVTEKYLLNREKI